MRYLLLLTLVGLGLRLTALPLAVHANNKQYALYEPTGSKTSNEADKKATTTENKRSNMLPIYFSPLLIVIIALAVRRRKKRNGQH